MAAELRRLPLLALALFLAACGGAEGQGPRTPGPAGESDQSAEGGEAAEADASEEDSGGPAAPDFSLPTLDGQTVRLSDFAGENVVLIDFWDTTCEPCLKAMPHLVRLYEENKDRGLVVLAISIDGPESRAQVSSVVHDKDMSFPVLLDEETSVLARYNPKRDLPFTVLIDKSGSIVMKKSGYQSGGEKALEAEVEKALTR